MNGLHSGHHGQARAHQRAACDCYVCKLCAITGRVAGNRARSESEFGAAASTAMHARLSFNGSRRTDSPDVTSVGVQGRLSAILTRLLAAMQTTWCLIGNPANSEKIGILGRRWRERPLQVSVKRARPEDKAARDTEFRGCLVEATPRNRSVKAVRDVQR